MTSSQLKPHATTHLLLTALVLVAIAFTLIDTVLPLWRDELLLAARQTDGSIWSTSVGALQWPDRLAVAAIAALQNLIWLYGLLQILLLCVGLRRHDVFSAATFRRLQHFGAALIGMALVAPWQRSWIIGYLRGQGYLDRAPELAGLVQWSEGVDFLFAGALVFLLASLFKSAVAMAEEQRLTV